MKKAFLFLVLTISIQTINAHPNTTAHAHETLLRMVLDFDSCIGCNWPDL